MRYSIVLLTATITAGCATQGVSNFNYTPPRQSNVQNEKTIGRPQTVVWDELVKELSKSFFVINNIERESRIINVSFSANTPADYVDCGRTRRTFTQGDKTESFDYAVAANSSYKMAGNKPDHPAMTSYALVTRNVSLEGRSNIYVAPDATTSGATVVSVNTRYIFSVKSRGNVYVVNIAGQVINSAPLPENPFTLSFNTNKPDSLTTAGVSLTCAGTGRLETEILRMVR